jgi:hypothetical protein
MVYIVSFSMTGMCRGRKCQFQYGWNVLKSVSFSMFETHYGQNRQLKHCWNVVWLITSVSACLEYAGKKIEASQQGAGDPVQNSGRSYNESTEVV